MIAISNSLNGNVLKRGPQSFEGSGMYIEPGLPSRYRVEGNFQISNDELMSIDIPGFDEPTIANATAPFIPDLDCVGALPHDAIDTRVIYEYETGTGQIGIGTDGERDWSGFSFAEHPAGYDEDLDGMADTWEAQMGWTDPVADDDRDGYTNIEEFLYEAGLFG